MTWLTGKKTYVASALLFLIGGAAGAGWITKEQSEHLYAMASALIAMAFRSAMTLESSRNVDATVELIDTVAPPKS